jgi:hypothetical protein
MSTQTPPVGSPIDAGLEYQPQYQSPVDAPHPGAGYAPAGQPPSVLPVVLFTLFFGVFGAISAVSRAGKAKAVGAPVGRYWAAFGSVIAGWIVLSIVIGVLSAASGGAEAPSGIDHKSLETSIVNGEEFKDSAGNTAKAKSATCVDVDVAEDGSGTYSCVVDFVDNRRQSFEIVMSSDGTWVTS